MSPWRHHHGRVTVGAAAALFALDAAAVVVEVGGEHLAVIVKCLKQYKHVTIFSITKKTGS